MKFYFEDTDEESREHIYSYSVEKGYDEDDTEPYSYAVLSRDPEIYKADSIYMKIFDELGITVEPLTDMDARIHDIENSAGIDDTIMQGAVALQFTGE